MLNQSYPRIKLFHYLFTKEALSNTSFMDAAIIFALNYPYPQTLEGFKEQRDAIMAFDARSRMHNILKPTLILSGSGQITGSTVLFTGGTIAGFTLLETAQESTIFDVNKTLCSRQEQRIS